MEIEDYVERIIDNGNIEDMHKLSEILDDIMDLLQKKDEESFEKYKMELYKMAYGSTLSREMAKEIVSKMRPYRENWSLDEVKEIQQQYGVDDIKSIDLYVVMNAAYNDYRDIFGDDIDMYIKYARDFIDDEDAKADKVFIYFTTIPE